MIRSLAEMEGMLPQQFQIDLYSTQIAGFYVCDTYEDLQDLPECGLGSIAYVAAPPSEYAKASTGEWVCQRTAKEEVS